MNVRELLMLGLVGWTLLGLLGTLISLVRQERAKAIRGVRWMLVVWVVYLGVLVGVSVGQRQRVIAMGQEQCFDEMCFAVMAVDEVPRFLGRQPLGRQPLDREPLVGKAPVGDGSRLVRVTIRVRNGARGKAQSESPLRAYVVDAQGRRWEESRGVSGNRLTGRVAAGGEMICEPVFKVGPDAMGLGLVLTHGRWQPGVLVIGDSDSWFHKRTVVSLGR
jgi:hypothetical protein